MSGQGVRGGQSPPEAESLLTLEHAKKAANLPLLLFYTVPKRILQLRKNYRVGQKTRLFLRSDNFATTDDRKACNMSKVSEFCLE